MITCNPINQRIGWTGPSLLDLKGKNEINKKKIKKINKVPKVSTNFPGSLDKSNR
jgi:hypothetical protein